MLKRSISTASIAAVLLSSAATLGVASAGSAAAAGTAVTVAAYGGIVVDDQLQRVFIGDRTNGTVVATDFSGNYLGSVPGVSSVTDLTVSTDGSTVYAAAYGTHDIVALDAAQLTIKARYAVATLYGPTHVAFTSGKVWFTYGDQWDGNLGSVDPTVDTSTGASAVTLKQFPTGNIGIWGQGILSTTPSEPGVLADGETGISTDSMAVVNVSSGTPVMTAWYQGDYKLNNGIHDFDLVPGASQVLFNGTVRDGYSGGTFSQVGAYPQGDSAAISADGYVAQAKGGAISVYPADADLPRRTFQTGAAYIANIGWAADDSRLFVMESASNYNSPATLQIFTEPTKDVPTLTATAPASGSLDTPVTISGRLTSDTPLPSGTELTVTRTDAANPSGLPLATPVTVAADGTWQFNDKPSVAGVNTYQFSYAGDATFGAATATASVNVAHIPTALTIATSASAVGYNGYTKVTAHLGSTYSSRVVAIYAQPYGLSPVKIANGTVDANGNISVNYRLTRTTRFAAYYFGDLRSAGATASSIWVTAQAAIGDALARYYGTGSYAGYSFRLYHKATLPLMGIAVGPNKGGESVRVYAQRYYSGAWHWLGNVPFTLNSSGQLALTLNFTSFPLGSHFRVAPLFAGDKLNAPTWGSWLYFSINR